MKYNVHIFALVRVKVADVEAENQSAAIRIALEKIDLYHQFEGETTEYAEEIARYMVDEVGDAEHSHTQTFLDLQHLHLNDQDIERGAAIFDATEL